MKPNNTGKNKLLQAQTVNQKLNHNAQTQDADRMQAFFCVIYDTVRGCISTIILLIEGGEVRALRPQSFCWVLATQHAGIYNGNLLTSPAGRTLLKLSNKFTLYLYYS